MSLPAVARLNFRSLLAGVLLAALLPGCTSFAPTASWDAEPSILAHIQAPQFPAKDFLITDYGAVAGGTQDCTAAINQAIAVCSAAGGGRVVVPSGQFLTGAIRLLSNVNLHLNDGATLKFSPNSAKYLPLVFTRFESTECLNYSPFIYAYQQENIAITGSGTLDGSADDKTWWDWTGPGNAAAADSRKLVALSDQGVPPEKRIFGDGYHLRPNFIQPNRCQNVLIEGVHIRNSPMWEVNPVLCTNVIVRGLDILSLGPNNDGCDPESCKDVLIEDCTFQTGDDCIAIKSGRNDDGRRIGVPTDGVIIRNCSMKDGHAGVAIGSEISGGCRNVFIENCQMDSPNLERALRFKNNAQRGGLLENFFMRNVTIGQVKEAVVTIDFLYQEGANGPYQATLRNVQLDNVTCQSSPRVMYVLGYPKAVIDQILFKNCTFKGITSPELLIDAGTVILQNTRIEPKEIPTSLSTQPNPSAP